jgi:hypothetical protein
MKPTIEELFAPRRDFLTLYQPLIGNSMLEFGDKVEGDHVYKDTFKALGYIHTSIDYNGNNGALALDLREPIALGQFDMVTNIGTSEHVKDRQEMVWRNMVSAVKLWGVLLSATPAPHNWSWHGHWYPTKEFYEELARLNGMEIERRIVSGSTPMEMLLVRMVKVREVPFVMPDESLLFFNPGGKEYVWEK